MKKMLSLLIVALTLVAAPVLAEKCCGKPNNPNRTEACDKCGCNKPKPNRTGDTTDKCGCSNKPKGTERGCGSCNSCNTCKPCGGCCK